MARTKKHPQEVRERVVLLVFDHGAQCPSRRETTRSIAGKIGLGTIHRGIVTALVLALTSCVTAVEPRILVRNRGPITEPLYLIAAKEKDAIADSLDRAGIQLTADLVSATAVIRVTRTSCHPSSADLQITM